MLQGEGTVQVGSEQKKVKAGDVVFLPTNIQHGFFNTGEKQVIIFLIGVKT
jgi:quercetin dioxygenase-like cupin family protein